MKKTLLALLSVVCMSLAGSAQDIVYLRQDAQSQGLRYQVASVDEDVLVRQEYFREDWPERKWFRDDLRNCLREEEGHVYTFDPQGRMLTHTYTLRGKSLRQTRCTYDPKTGRLTSLVGEGCKVVPHGRDLDIYAESGTYANEQLEGHRPDYAFDMTCRMEWADDGLLLASRYYYVDSLPAKSYEYQYNHRGQIAEQVALVYAPHSTEAQRTVTRFSYDGNDCLKRMTIRGGEQDDVYTFENNAQGDPVQMTVSTPYSTVVYTYEYRYDESGNWTMRLMWKDGRFENATLRTIRYHRGGDAMSQALAEEQAAEAEAQAQAKIEAKAKAKAKAEKPAKEPKAKAEKAPKEPKQKAEKPAKEPKQKAEKPAKEPKQKAEKPAKKTKEKKQKDGNIPDELQ